MFFFKHSLISLLSLCLPIFWQHYWPLSLPKPHLTDCLATTTVTSANTTFSYPHRLTKIDFPKEKELRKVCPLCCAVCLPVIFFPSTVFCSTINDLLVFLPHPPRSLFLPKQHIFWFTSSCPVVCVCVFVIVVEPSSSEPSSSSVPKDPESVRKARPGGGGRNSWLWFDFTLVSKRDAPSATTQEIVLPSSTSVFWPSRHGTWLCFFPFSFWWREDSQRQFRQKGSKDANQRKIDESPKNKVRLITIVNLLIPFLVVQTLRGDIPRALESLHSLGDALCLMKLRCIWLQQSNSKAMNFENSFSLLSDSEKHMRTTFILQNVLIELLTQPVTKVLPRKGL